MSAGHDDPGSHSPAGHASAGHGSDGHADAEDLGPVDYGAWAAGIVGVLVGLLIVACFVLATSPITA